MKQQSDIITAHQLADAQSGLDGARRFSKAVGLDVTGGIDDAQPLPLRQAISYLGHSAKGRQLVDYARQAQLKLVRCTIDSAMDSWQPWQDVLLSDHQALLIPAQDNPAQEALIIGKQIAMAKLRQNAVVPGYGQTVNWDQNSWVKARLFQEAHTRVVAYDLWSQAPGGQDAVKTASFGWPQYLADWVMTAAEPDLRPADRDRYIFDLAYELLQKNYQNGQSVWQNAWQHSQTNQAATAVQIMSPAWLIDSEAYVQTVLQKNQPATETTGKVISIDQFRHRRNGFLAS